jgi:ABC-2 type transport system ATP-binding protein
MPVIEVRDLKKRYGAHVALRGIDFSVDRGEVVGLLGPNGAGKSTAMKILTGYLSATTGLAQVMGIDVVSDPVAARRHVGYLPESAPVYGDMRVQDYLDFAGQIRSLGSAERAAAVGRAMDRTGLTPRARQAIGTLSKGFKQRVGLAQAILHEPDILILDEPTSGLDPNQIVDIRSLIRELGARKTVLLSTHILSEVQATCDRVIIISEGLLVADGPTAAITARQEGAVTTLHVAPGDVRLSPDQWVAAVRELAEVRDVRVVPGVDMREGEIQVEVIAERDIRADLFRLVVARGLVVLELRAERNSLEEVFRSLTGLRADAG